MSRLGWCFMCGDDLDATGWVELHPCRHVLCPHCLCSREAVRGYNPLVCPREGCGVLVQSHCYMKAKKVRNETDNSKSVVVAHLYDDESPQPTTRDKDDYSNQHQQGLGGNNQASSIEAREEGKSQEQTPDSRPRLSRSRRAPARFSDYVTVPQNNSSVESKTSDPETLIDQELQEEVGQIRDGSGKTATREGSTVDNETKEEDLGTPTSSGRLTRSRRPPDRFSSSTYSVPEEEETTRKKSTAAQKNSASATETPEGSASEVKKCQDEPSKREGASLESTPNPGIQVPHYANYPQIPFHDSPHGPLYNAFEYKQPPLGIEVPVISKLENGITRGTTRRIRKNAQSRVRSAQKRRIVSKLKEKSQEELTEEEKATLSQFEERRQRKNLRSKERQAERKQEVERILAKPEQKRTKEEKYYLKTIMEKKRRKNMGDRLRRMKQKGSAGESSSFHAAPSLAPTLTWPGHGQQPSGYPNYFHEAQVAPARPPSLPPHIQIIPAPHALSPLRPPLPAFREEDLQSQRREAGYAFSPQYPAALACSPPTQVDNETTYPALSPLWKNDIQPRVSELAPSPAAFVRTAEFDNATLTLTRADRSANSSPTTHSQPTGSEAQTPATNSSNAVSGPRPRPSPVVEPMVINARAPPGIPPSPPKNSTDSQLSVDGDVVAV